MRARIFFYLPHGHDFYGEAVVFEGQETVRDFDHVLRTSDEVAVLSPAEISLEVLHPGNFLNMVTHWSVSRVWLVDRIRGPEPLIHIVDHRNVSGQNPLRGRTPLGDRQRFPDVSGLYGRQDLGIAQRVVTTVGPERFRAADIAECSEMAALVALCAGYVGMDVVGIGWNDEQDPNGDLLARFVQKTVVEKGNR